MPATMASDRLNRLGYSLYTGGSINPVQDAVIVSRRGAAWNDVKGKKVEYFSSSHILEQST